MSIPVRIGTRRSPLARRQSQQVADLLAQLLGRPVTLVDVTTRGDVDPAPLAAIGGAGVFVSALRSSLLDGEVDLAVHSMKDLPTADAPGLSLAAVPARLDPRDALVGTRLDALRPGARVGTGSPRRAAALRALGRGVEPVAIRGNVDTRLEMVRQGRLDAVVLAVAGLTRLGRRDLVVDPLDPTVMLPAPGQGALAVEACHDVTDDLAAALSALDDAASRAAVTAERAALAGLQAGCSAPVGAVGLVVGHEVALDARVWSQDGRDVVAGHARGPAADAASVGHTLARDLLARGAASLMSTPNPELKETAL